MKNICTSVLWDIQSKTLIAVKAEINWELVYIIKPGLVVQTKLTVTK